MPPIGLALGSGGARGWCHIGVLRGLEAAGLGPARVAGASMGALVGAAWAAGRLDALADWALGLTPARFIALLDPRPASGGLVAGREILKVLTEIGLPERIEDLPVPFAAVATDMATGREVWLRRGPLAAAVRASVAIPGVLSPVRLDGRWMLDGGLTNPVPVSVARALGAEAVIAVNPNARLDGLLWKAPAARSSWHALADGLPAGVKAQIGSLLPGPVEDEAPPHLLDVVSVAIDVMTEQIRRARLAGDPPDLLLPASLAEMSVFDFHRAGAAIAEGERMVAAAGPQVAALLAGAAAGTRA